MEEKLHKRRCYRKYEYEDLPIFKKLQNSGRMRLESFERAVRFYFEHSTMKLGYMQKRLVDVFIIAALRKFFQSDLIANLKFLANKYLISELSDAIAILFPYFTHFFTFIYHYFTIFLFFLGLSSSSSFFLRFLCFLSIYLRFINLLSLRS